MPAPVELRTLGGDPPLGDTDLRFAGRVVDSAASAIEKALDREESGRREDALRQLAEREPPDRIEGRCGHVVGDTRYDICFRTNPRQYDLEAQPGKIVSYAGEALGSEWKNARSAFEYVDYAVIALVVLAIVNAVIRRRRRRRDPGDAAPDAAG